MLRREFAACQKMLTASIKVHVLHCGVRAGYWPRTVSSRGARWRGYASGAFRRSASSPSQTTTWT